jgi:putative acetyltransferase
MTEITPPESVHALDLEALRSPRVTFWSVWEGGELLGCGALKELGPTSGEIKSMHTANVHRRKGVGSKLLDHILKEAMLRGYDPINLETGATPQFANARAFYERHGFAYRDSFGDYGDDPNSAFMTKRLQSPDASLRLQTDGPPR